MKMTVSIRARKISSEELCSLVRGELILLIDCRPFSAYQDCHIMGSINAHVPKLLRRRSKGSLKLENILNCSGSREKLRRGIISKVVAYDANTSDITECEPSDELASIIDCFSQDPQSYLTTEICYLQGGFGRFSSLYPSLCESTQTTQHNPSISQFRLQPLQVPEIRHPPTTGRIVGSGGLRGGVSKPRPRLPKLCLQPTPGVNLNKGFVDPRRLGYGECQSVPSGRGTDEPVSVLPHLYLGSACHSGCQKTLATLGITAVLNVSKKCSNHFPGSLLYKNIPVEDDTDADLSSWFHEAASFIDSVKANNGRVFVHCKAGISRSATICMAYLMISQRYRLDEAFEYVHLRRTIISPNLAFMLQLQRLETDLFGKAAKTPEVTNPDAEFFAGRRIVRSVSLPSNCVANIGLSPSPATSAVGGLKKNSLEVSARHVNLRDKWSPGYFCPSPFQSFHHIASPS